ncbi:MAG: hypothetical protein JSS66_00035 [Armatimonadetes bacterium]|nr:hypothetical protein [Armatimonadota bacterium]
MQQAVDLRLLGKTARFSRLTSGIVGRGRVSLCDGGQLSIEMDRPLVANAIGEVFLEVYSGEDVCQMEMELVSVSPKEALLQMKAEEPRMKGDVKLWWTIQLVHGHAGMGFVTCPVAIKAVGSNHLAFDSSLDLNFEPEYVRVSTEYEDCEVKICRVQKREFGGVLHGLMEIHHPTRIELAKWRQIVAQLTGIDSKYM